MLDSGCTQHMTGNDSLFTSLEGPGDNEQVTFGDNSKGKVQGLGKIDISKEHSISNVLLVDSLSYNLLSVGQLCDIGLEYHFKQSEVVVTKSEDGSQVFKGFWHNNLYVVDLTSKKANLQECLFTKSSKGWLWHRRLAHVGMETLKKLMKKQMVRGLKDITFEKDKL